MMGVSVMETIVAMAITNVESCRNWCSNYAGPSPYGSVLLWSIMQIIHWIHVLLPVSIALQNQFAFAV
jgi:hypothetical protein